MVQRRGAGKVADWVVCSIAVACIVTFAAVAIGIELLVDQLHWSPREVDLGWARYGITFVVAFWILASWLPPARLSRALRVAVGLPALHALVLAVAWPVWHAIAPALPCDGAVTTFVRDFPFETVAAATGVGFVMFGIVVARRRSGEWIHGFAMLALAELLLLGLWMPIACAAWPGGHGEWWTPSQPLLANATGQVALIIIPPTLAALAFTAVALRRPALLSKHRALIGQCVAALFIVAVIARIGASARVMVLYTNFLPLLFVTSIVAIGALLALGTLTWWRAFVGDRMLRRRARYVGVIVDDDKQPVIGVEITSWLRGPRIVQRPFAVSTKEGTLPVRGAHVVGPLPSATTQLRAGECMALVNPGDSVTIGGIDEAHGDPFRTSAAPLANDMLIAPAPVGRVGFVHTTLAMWRPCVAYLLIVTAVALPGLAALLAE